MNKEKQFYEAPTAQTFVVRFEGMICQSFTTNSLNATEYIGSDGDYEDL